MSDRNRFTDAYAQNLNEDFDQDPFPSDTVLIRHTSSCYDDHAREVMGMARF